MGVFLIALSVIVFFINLISDTTSAIQQTVQYLGYVCAAVFLSAGFIILKLDQIIKERITSEQKTSKADANKKDIKEPEPQDSTQKGIIILVVVIGIVAAIAFFKIVAKNF